MPERTRAHHYVPAFYLAGFANPQRRDGRLWVLDSHNGRQWASSPQGAGHQRDFYRVSAGPELPENYVEQVLSRLESDIAGVVRAVQTDKTLPEQDDLDTLIGFFALMFTRVPWFRATVSEAHTQIIKRVVDLITASPTHWEAALRDAAEQGLDVGLSREEMREVLDADKYSINVSQNYTLGMMLRMTEQIYPAVRARNWSLLISEKARSAPFITSDHCCPVKSQIESIGWGHRGIRFGSRMAGVPVKGAFFRIA